MIAAIYRLCLANECRSYFSFKTNQSYYRVGFVNKGSSAPVYDRIGGRIRNKVTFIIIRVNIFVKHMLYNIYASIYFFIFVPEDVLASVSRYLVT